MSAWNWVQLAVAIIIAVVSAVGKQMNKWLGFFLIMGAGVLMIVMSIISRDYRFAPLGAWGVLSDIIAAIAYAQFAPQAEDDTLGGAASGTPWWAWLIIAVLFVIAIVLAFVLPTPVRRI
jgi:predicted membrane channel-forming protein YqfA (hemolysin III family)